MLATTVLQTCIRYQSRTKTCQFCAIGQSLAAGRTIERKTPAQLAEVAKAAVELDGVKHMVMTTGTPAGADRGAAILCESAAAVKAAVDLPIQGAVRAARRRRLVRPHEGRRGRCARHASRSRHAGGARARHARQGAGLGRRAISRRSRAAVPVFGRGQVSTYILAGLGDSAARHPGDVPAPGRDRRLSFRRAVRADRRHAAGKPSDARARLHARASSAPLAQLLGRQRHRR